jgi:hypothetical protein
VLHLFNWCTPPSPLLLLPQPLLLNWCTPPSPLLLLLLIQLDKCSWRLHQLGHQLGHQKHKQALMKRSLQDFSKIKLHLNLLNKTLLLAKLSSVLAVV